MTFSKQPGAPGIATGKPPSSYLAAAEIPRALAELTLFAAAYPGLLGLAARGDGHPVLVLPGLLASDRSTTALRKTLNELGYDARPWGLGRNRGPRSIGPNGEHLMARVEALFQETGKKVSLVGWSLGGILARLVTRRMPNRIRQVITLGSPFADNGGATNANKVFELASGTQASDRVNRKMFAELAGPSSVPSSAIYSRSDGICAWRACREAEAPGRESIEVYGSHCGLGVNPSVIYVVSDRLAQAENAWAPFAPRGWASWAFPAAGNA